MKLDKMFRIMRFVDPIPDGMGGWIETESEESIGTIFGFVTPAIADKLLKDYGVVSTTAIKIFTKDYVPKNDSIYLKYVDYSDNIDQNYEILQVADYEKYTMILAQKEGD